MLTKTLQSNFEGLINSQILQVDLCRQASVPVQRPAEFRNPPLQISLQGLKLLLSPHSGKLIQVACSQDIGISLNQMFLTSVTVKV